MYKLLRSAAFRRLQEAIARGAKKKDDTVVAESRDRINIFKKFKDPVWRPLSDYPQFLRQYSERTRWSIQQTRLIEGQYTMQLLPTEYKRYLSGYKRERNKIRDYYYRHMSRIRVDENDYDMYEPQSVDIVLTPEERQQEREPTTVEEESQEEEEASGAPKGRRRQQ